MFTTDYIPIIGAIVLIVNYVKQGKLVEKIKEIAKNYQDAQDKGAADKVKLARAYSELSQN